MNASSRIDPIEAKEAIECLLDESAQDLMDLLVEFIDRVLDSGTPMALLAARALFVEVPDLGFQFTGLGRALCQLNRFDILRRAADTILRDLRNRLAGPQVGVEAEHGPVN